MALSFDSTHGRVPYCQAEVIAKDAEEEMQRIREELNVEKQRSVQAEERILELQSHVTAKQVIFFGKHFHLRLSEV